MSVFGAVVGGSIGFMFGGPIGAAAGAAVGGYISEDEETDVPDEDAYHTAFLIAVFASLGKLAKADGCVTADEIACVTEFMTENLELDADDQRAAIDVFNRAKNSDDDFIEYVTQFAEIFEDDSEARWTFFHVLCEVAMADGELHDQEYACLQEAAMAFGIEESYLEGLFYPSEEDEEDQHAHLVACYALLGVNEDASQNEIKTAYRQKMKEFHPDTIESKGLPPAFKKFAEEKVQEIRDAYETLRS